ncbi:shikimate kinase [Pelistega ratti]|uniref:shikimate kinase n=1 Tax=Pelistega ratti TaxID=2652177 RepID=UPI0013597BF4|nr:shikimate kinase [Pelistega ratti]
MTKTAVNEQIYPPLIIFIGMMGAGKTTIGRALARELNIEFIDLDHEIVQRCGVAIPTIFDIEGEDGFRKRETAVLAEVIQQKNIVLATGGGAILATENQALLKKGLVVYLKASADELFCRIAKDSNRPLLKTENPQDKVKQLLAVRSPIYEKLADITVETGNQTIYATVKKLKKAIIALQENT